MLSTITAIVPEKLQAEPNVIRRIGSFAKKAACLLTAETS